MWNSKKTLFITPTILNIDGNVSRARVVDPYGQQEFLINSYGWLTSDISLLLRADQQNIQDNLLSRLQVLKSDNPNMSEREMLDSLVPRYCQSYAERAQFMKYMHEEHPDFFEDTSETDESVKSDDVKDV